MHKFAILAALLFVSFGFTSAYADDTLVDPDSISFGHIPQYTLSQHVPQITDPLTGEEAVIDKSRHYLAYAEEFGSTIDSNEKQLVSIDGQQFYLVPDPFDSTANILAVLLLAVPFGLLVYRMSDNDPIPLKYAKLSGVVVFFAMASMLTMPITIGNSFWGYASATESELNIPEPMDFLYFDTGNNYLSHGTNIILDQENSAVSFDGTNDYLVLSSNLSERLDELSVSAWVKPDYKKGASATLSIVSEANAFDLSINNDKVDKNVAIFSVFDGIKWHQVQSKSAIQETWTHISATYSGNEIKIFVNGAQEGTQRIDGDYSLTHQYGESSQNSYDYISSKSNILIGAFNPSIRDASSVQNHFSGLIDDITLYDKLLSSDNISALEQINRTPDTILESEVQSVETTPEQTGTENKYGFTTADENPNDQKIEEVAAEGYKVKKPEETKKKDKASLTTTPEIVEQPTETTVPEFDESIVVISTSSTTTVCHIPPGNPNNNKTLTIGESALDAHLGHGDKVPNCEFFSPVPLSPSDLRKAPQSVQSIDDDSSLSKQLIRVSTDTASTFSDLPTINSRLAYEWKLYGDLNGTMVDLTNNPNVDLQLLDINLDNVLDRAEWNTADEITEYYLVAKIILATGASHLDSNRDYVDDIFYEIREQDGIWSYAIPEGDYVRVTFERALNNTNDITVYAKSGGSASIEVYEKDGTDLIATFSDIAEPKTSKIFLTSLSGPQETFDLLIKGASVQFDLIIDPSISYDKGVYRSDQAKWTTGNAGMDYQEGDWVSYRYDVSSTVSEIEVSQPVPSFLVGNEHYDTAKNAVFIDAFANFRYCIDNSTNSCPALPNGISEPSGLSAPEEAKWLEFTPANINRVLESNSGPCVNEDPTNDPQQKHCFTIEPGVGGLPSEFGVGDQVLRIFWQAHMSMSSTWASGNENQMAVMGSPYEILPPSGAEPQVVYGTDAYDDWTTAFERGVGFSAGSSNHFFITNQSAGPSGSLDLPIPSVSSPFGSITIIKDMIPNSTQFVNYTTTGTGLEDFDLDDNGINGDILDNTKIFIGLDTGDYSVKETLPIPGYSLSMISCDITQSNQMGAGDSTYETNLETGNLTISLFDGAQVVCTFTNMENPPVLKLVKNVDNGDGGSASPTDWDLNATSDDDGARDFEDDGDPAIGIFHDVFAGDQYTLIEKPSTTNGYTSDGVWSCVDNNDGGSSYTTDGDNLVTLGAGENVTCTITNDDVAPVLKLVKNVDNGDGGSASPTDWDLNATSDDDGARDFEDDGDPAIGIFHDVFAGDQYTLIEKPSTTNGYTSDGVWSCVDNNDGGSSYTTDGDNLVTLGAGENVTCTITNDDVAPVLKLVKNVDNGDGGSASPTDWDLNATSDDDGARDFEDDGDPAIGIFHDVFAGDQYTLIEKPSTTNGYTSDGVWSCVDNNDGGSSYTTDGDNLVTLGAGENVTCTITNDDVAPVLKLVKNVDNGDGGSASPTDWDLNATSDDDGARDFEDDGDPAIGIFHDVFAGDQYTLIEKPSTTNGYTSDGVWSCVDNNDGGSSYTTDGDNLVTLGAGENVTCTITNDDVAPVLKLVKNVDNGDGGSASPTDWDLNATSDDDGARDFEDDGDPAIGIFHDVFAGDQYTLIEKPSTTNGYTSDGVWSCVDNNDGGSSYTTDGDNLVTLGAGENVTCTITNDDVAPVLKLVKNVDNGDGGSASPTDWDLNATSDDDGARDFEDDGDPAIGIFHDVFAGDQYTLIEKPSTTNGYTSDGVWSCVDNNDGGSSYTTDGDNLVTLGAGENVTCTITNDDVAPVLKLVKKVINNDGGNKTAGNWTLFAVASNPANSTNDFSNLGDAGELTQVFPNIIYNLTETDVDGYVLDGWECRDDNTNAIISTTDQVTLNLGQNATCTVINDDVPAFLKIIKNTTDDSFDDRNFSFKFFITDANGNVTTENVIVPGGNHTGMSDIILVPSGFLSVEEDVYINWSLLNVKCEIFQLDEDLNKISSIANTTDATNLNLDSFQLAECTFVNWNPHGFITGGGRINLDITNPDHQVNITSGPLVDKVSHGFELHCNVNSGPNNLEVNWNGNKFHLDELERAGCFDDDSVNEPPPTTKGKKKPTLDIYHGEGWGRYNGECGAFASWTIDDNSEPGKADHIISLVIYEDVNATIPVLSINPGELNVMDTSSAGTWKEPGRFANGTLIPDPWLDIEGGNHQWVPHPAKSHGPTHTTPCEEITPPVMINNTAVIDNDFDGLSSINEKLSTFAFATDPLDPDTDNDGLTDGDEIFIYETDPTIPDIDLDGLLDGDEILYGTNPFVFDTDADGLSDGNEVNAYGTDPTLADTDGDTLTDSDEINLYSTNPLVTDTDGDTLTDDNELAIGTDPTLADTDGDTLTDSDEVNLYSTNPLVTDTDGDTLTDDNELAIGTDPTLADTDGDTLTDDNELAIGTDPTLADTDGDTLTDDNELAIGTDPTLADTDGDTLTDSDEVNLYSTNPLVTDTDGDTLTDSDEVNLYSTNPLVTDTDGDTLTDSDEVNLYSTNPLVADTDGDTLTDDNELAIGTDPTLADTDGDTLTDDNELAIGTDPTLADTDGDTLTDDNELAIGTDPTLADTDGDTLTDSDEINLYSTNPLVTDTDGDTLTDDNELAIGTDPTLADTDGDTLTDDNELAIGTDPTLADTDGDTLTDDNELAIGTDPTLADTDGDTLTDDNELAIGTDPTLADTDGDGLSDSTEVNIHGTDPIVADTDGGGVNDGDEITNGLNPLKRNDDRFL